MIAPLNPWRDSALRKAERLFEDSDRQAFAAAPFRTLIWTAHHLATVSAHVVPEPTIGRLVLDDGCVLLSLEWRDEASGWSLYLAVRRKAPVKPVVVLEFCGEPSDYSTDKPSNTDITKALHDYFEAWKRN